MSDVLNNMSDVFPKTSDIMYDINTEKSHDRHAQCPSQFRGMSVINPVNVGQNVRYLKKVFIYTACDIMFLNSKKSEGPLVLLKALHLKKTGPYMSRNLFRHTFCIV